MFQIFKVSTDTTLKEILQKMYSRPFASCDEKRLIEMYYAYNIHI